MPNNAHMPSADRGSQRAQTRGQHDLLIESLRAAAVSPESFDLPTLLMRAASALSSWEAQAAGEAVEGVVEEAFIWRGEYAEKEHHIATKLPIGSRVMVAALNPAIPKEDGGR